MDSTSNVAENEARIEEHLENLRRLILKDESLNSPVDDEFLVQFVRARKYNIEAAAAQVKKYWELKGSVPEIIALLHPSLHKGTFEEVISVFKTRSNGRHVLHLRFGVWDPSRVSADELIAIVFLVTDHLNSFKETQLNGILVIFDLSGISLTHVLSFSPKRIHQFAKAVQGIYPARFKGFHVINNPAIAGIILAILRPVLKPKMRKRVILHGYKYQETLTNAIGSHVLPEFMGGNVSSNDYEDRDYLSDVYLKDDYYRRMTEYGLSR